MASFSARSFERKLKEMSARQDSVQTVSLWVIHHRAHSRAVVNVWQEHVKKAKPERRLILFYLANDVIQNSRKKGKEFSSSFGKVLSGTMPYLRDSQIRPSVERVLKIWQERKVFEKSVVQKLVALLYQEAAKPEVKVKVKAAEKKKDVPAVKKPVPRDFKVATVIGAIVKMQEHEAETQIRENRVSQLRLDASSSDGIKQLKDYAGGNRFSMEFEESSIKVEELVESLESENRHRHSLIDALENSESFYGAALKEATIIANAYRQFGNRLHTMKKKLDNKIRKFATAEKEAPVSAPKASFLSSGLSGIMEEVNKSPAASPKRSGEKRAGLAKKKGEENAKESEEEIVVDPTVDHVEVADMDIESDSENEDSGNSETQESSDSTTNNASSSTSNATPVTTAATATVPVTTGTAVMVGAEETAANDEQQHFGYTVTANNTENLGNVSPASHDSAPSPEGSPDLNLDEYEGGSEEHVTSGPGLETGTDHLQADGNLLLRDNSDHASEPSMLNNEFREQSSSDSGTESGSKPLHPVNLIAQLISKNRRQQESSAENSPQSAVPQENTENQAPEKPLYSIIDSLFPVLSTSLRTLHGDDENGGQPEEQLPDDGQDIQQSNHEEVTEESYPEAIPDCSDVPIEDAAQPIRSDIPPDSEVFDEESPEGDNTPEHGAETAEFAPIIIRPGGDAQRYIPRQARERDVSNEFPDEFSSARGLNPISFREDEVPRAPISQLDQRLTQNAIPTTIRNRRSSLEGADTGYDNGPLQRRNPYVPMDPRRNTPLERRGPSFHSQDIRSANTDGFTFGKRRVLSHGNDAQFSEQRPNISRVPLDECRPSDGDRGRAELGRLNQFTPMQIRPADRRPEIGFNDTRENHHGGQRRDGFHDFRAINRGGGRLPTPRKQFRPGMFRGDPQPDFYPPFMRPAMRFMGRTDIRHKRQGPPFAHDPAKRPHF